MANPKVLAVDDSRTIRKAIEITFKGENFDLMFASSGQEGIEKVRQQHPHVVLLDHRMPPPDGYELAAAIKSDPALAGTKVVVMCSRAQPFDAARGAAADAHIVKPFETQVLIELVDRLAREAVESMAATAAPARVAPSPQAQPPAAAPPMPQPAMPQPPPMASVGMDDDFLEDELEITIEDDEVETPATPEPETPQAPAVSRPAPAASSPVPRADIRETKLFGSPPSIPTSSIPQRPSRPAAQDRPGTQPQSPARADDQQNPISLTTKKSGTLLSGGPDVQHARAGEQPSPSVQQPTHQTPATVQPQGDQREKRPQPLVAGAPSFRRPEPKPEPKPEFKPEFKPEPKPEPKPAQVPPFQPAATPQPQTPAAPSFHRPEPKPEPKPKFEPAPKSEPRPEFKPEPKPEFRAEPKPAQPAPFQPAASPQQQTPAAPTFHRPEPKPEPKPKFEPAPKSEPVPSEPQPLQPDAVPTTAARAASPQEKTVGKEVASGAVAEVLDKVAAKGPDYEAIAKLSKDVIEQIVWEVVPELAELLIKEYLAKNGLPKP